MLILCYFGYTERFVKAVVHLIRDDSYTMAIEEMTTTVYTKTGLEDLDADSLESCRITLYS